MSLPITSLEAWKRTLFPPGARIASAPLVFLSVIIVGIFQLPASALIRADFLSLGIFVNEVVAIAGVPLVIIWLLKFDPRRLIPLWAPSLKTISLLVLFCLGSVVVMDFLTAASEFLLPLPQEIQALYDQLMGAHSAFEIGWKFILLCLLPGICEEIFFRGFCQNSLRALWGEKRAIFVIAFFFALLHGNPYYLHLYFLLGLIFGFAMSITGTLWAAIFCHVVNNSWTYFGHVFEISLPDMEMPPVVKWMLFVAALILLLFAAVMLARISPRRSTCSPGEGSPSNVE